jgi:hypothetical protein
MSDTTVAPDPTGAVSRYEAIPNWGLLPHGMTFHGDATGVAVDAQDRVFIFNRGPNPVMIFDRDGNFLTSWGEGEFTSPHEITIDKHDDVYLVDSAGHFVQKRTGDGQVVFTIGKPGEPAERHSGIPFNLPTDVAVHPETGELFVSDGYGNSHIHRFSAAGELIQSWGEPGSAPGQFSLPHGIAVLPNDEVIVCDRENFRLQTFTTAGKFLRQCHAHHPSAVLYSEANDVLFVGELGPVWYQHGLPNLGNRVVVMRRDGEVLDRIGAPEAGFRPDQFTAPHSLALDSRRDLYVAEVSRSYLSGVLNQEPPLGENVSLRKWRRVS